MEYVSVSVGGRSVLGERGAAIRFQFLTLHRFVYQELKF